MDKKNYYRIYTNNSNIDHDYLLEDDDGYLIEIEIKKILKTTISEGRIQTEPKEIKLQSELEGEYEHYSKEEIEANLKRAIPEEFDCTGNFCMISGALLSTLEQSGVTCFKAFPIYLSHKSTQRIWKNYWYLTFTYEQYLPLLTGKELCFKDKELFVVYFAESVIQNIEKSNVKTLTFEKHELPLCQSVSLSTISNASNQIIKDIEELFTYKKPRASKDAAYSINFFLRKLQEKYSDITPTKVIECIENDNNQTFEVKENKFIFIKSNSLLYQKLFN